jgi:hypothetical protein
MLVTKISNNSSTLTSGTLRLELWATTTPYSGGTLTGYRVLKYQITGSSSGTLPPNTYFSDVNSGTVAVDARPPQGSYYATLVVAEFDSTSCSTSDKFCIKDYSNFTAPLNVPATSSGGGGGGGGSDGGDDDGGGGQITPLTLGLLVLTGLLAWRRQRIRAASARD